MKKQQQKRPGKVFLVGAGPGDPGLITCKGLECLKQADVVVYDYLANERMVEYATEKSEKIYVGKTAKNHTLSQKEINELLVASAREGKVVVRLKGGDPFVFGRGGEEAEVLLKNGIPFEVVPGVTSAIAVPAYTGIPVTHRGLASSFSVVTGHEDPTKEVSSLNWEKLSTGTDTLVFLMGMQNISSICENLIENGRDAATPVAVIRDGTRATQTTVIGTLRDIVKKVNERNVGAPAIIVVGNVVGLSEKLQWIEKRPLAGKRILVTRARRQASKLSRLLEERGAEPFELPVIEIEPYTDNPELQYSVRNLGIFQWIIFTSVNGVDTFFKVLNGNGLDTRSLSGIKIWAIGSATAASLSENGIIPDYVPDIYTTEGLIAGLDKCDIIGKHFLLPRADIADDILAKAIKERGGEVKEVVAYRTRPVRDSVEKVNSLLISGEIDVITFTSSSTVNNLVDALQSKELYTDRVKTACIGPRTADTARNAGFKVDILADEQTIPGLVDALEEYFKEEA